MEVVVRLVVQKDGRGRESEMAPGPNSKNELLTESGVWDAAGVRVTSRLQVVNEC